MSEERRNQLMKVTEANGLPVIEDDVYRDLWLDTPPVRPLKAEDTTGNVLYLGSLSKTISPGLRIGWIAGPQPVLERLADIKMQSDYGSSALSQQVAAEWLSSGMYEQHVQYVRQQLRMRRAAMLSSLDRHFTGIASWNVPAGGFYIWLKLHSPLPARALFDRALRQNILINPGHLYDRDANQYIRLSYSFASLEHMEDSLARLAAIIKSIS
ncbi:HTH-type transcriptional regulator NorG [compost metagenome]